MPPRPRLYQQAQTDLKHYIEAQALGPGDALPPESALAQELGMSRLSLREAMKSLEALGIVEARQGNGVYIKAFSFDPIVENLRYSFVADGRSLRNLLQVRQALEEGLMRDVIERLQDADIVDLEALANEMEAQIARGESHLDTDLEFHRRLFARLENPFLIRLIDLFWSVFHQLRSKAHWPPPEPLSIGQRHQAIVDALRSRDEARAVAAMTAHFKLMRERIDELGELSTNGLG